MNTTDGIAAFLTAKTAKGLTAQTIQGYRYRLTIFSRFHRFLPTTPEQIESFLARTGPSQETKATYFRILRAFYKWLERRKAITQNPLTMVESPLLRPKVARALSIEVLSVLLNHPGHSPTIRAFLYLLADTGLRLSEALSIRSPDHFAESTAWVTGKVGEREVPVSPMVREMMLKVGPWPWANHQTAGLAVRRAFRRASILGRRASAQTLRHTFVRHWQGDESLLVGILGWSSPRMLQVYRPYDIRRAVVQHRQLSPIREVNGTRQLPLL